MSQLMNIEKLGRGSLESGIGINVPVPNALRFVVGHGQRPNWTMPSTDCRKNSKRSINAGTSLNALNSFGNPQGRVVENSKEYNRILRDEERGRLKAAAFTLIELLVVIAIIATLAGLTLTVLPGARDWRVKRAVEAQMRQLQTAIEGYRDERGYYPPSSPFSTGTNLLYYELMGVTYSPSSANRLDVVGRGNESILSSQIQAISGRSRILNTVISTNNTDPNRFFDPDYQKDAPSFHANINEKQARDRGDGIKLLVVPAEGPDGDFNPWQYTAPGTNNPASFDLWADVKLTRKTIRIANWQH